MELDRVKCDCCGRFMKAKVKRRRKGRPNLHVVKMRVGRKEFSLRVPGVYDVCDICHSKLHSK